MARRSLAKQLLLVLLSTATLLAGVQMGRALEPVDPEPRAWVGPGLRHPALELPDPIRGDLRRRQWSGAATSLIRLGLDAFPGAQRGDWAFLVVWSLIHAERAEEAAQVLPLMEGADAVPEAYADLARGEVYRATEQPLKALEWLERVPEDRAIWGRAAVHRAEVLRELGRTREAFELYETLAARPDPALGSAEALLALGLHHGAGSEKAYPYLRRLWWAYPRSESATEGARLLGAYSSSQYRSTWEEVGRRAERLMDRGEYGAATAETGRVASKVSGTSVDACRFVLVRGRSHYKRNQLTSALTAFGDTGHHCDPEAAEYGSKILYLEAMVRYRRMEFGAAAEAFEAIADRYPDTNLADDGLTMAGIALERSGEVDDARLRWQRALDQFPAGDTTPEATWRHAFSLYLEGRPEEARELATTLGTLPLEGDPVHVAAGRYWYARWLLYPDVDAPTVPDPEGRDEAVAEWWRLCEDLPHSFYAILAYSRLVEEAPDVAAGLAYRPPGHDSGNLDEPWVVRQAFLDGTGGVAIDLFRLGLLHEASAEWNTLDPKALTPDEFAWMIEARSGSGDWLHAHDTMRKWMTHHPPGTLGPNEPRVLRIGYPDRYWGEVQTAAAGDRYEPRLLHALIREESNFNRQISSHVGAQGLAQLMPGTAREVAGWLGKQVTTADLADPATNLELGAKYFDFMHKQSGGSPYLSLASYNAGGGRVGEWHSEWGDMPTDEFVERIPYKETREYVKRVMGTWQIMRWQFDDGEAFPDLSAYNHHALPDDG
jgi:tetratricopeptide (TPR) repeat protein